MVDTGWGLDASDGELTVHTGVDGRAARMGHRLTIRMQTWRIAVDWNGDVPVSGQLVVDVDSLQVLSGEGGVTPLSGPEKGIARSNALKTLGAEKFPTIEFSAETIAARPGGYRLSGPLRIHGVSRAIEVDLDVDQDGEGGSQWQMSTSATVSQRDFGIKPYSMMMGTMKVADEVTVRFAAHRSKP
ncbi:YceI family protein [Mycolicibacterium palauense]|uniref:YceI family protein n=1 Tax=Mycolicibacterium palauense TaxID=2034511 RepID=UPI000BFEB27C|nr:YceI family protein [Mycolicibacterium palauense]